MPVLDDQRTLSLLAFVSKGFGQFPVVKNKTEGKRVNFLSPAGIWCLFLVAIHFLCGQTVYVQVHEEFKRPSYPGEETTGMALVFLQLAVAVQGYGLFLCWLLLLPKFLRCWALASEYDIAFKIKSTAHVTRTNIKYLVAYVVPWMFGCVLSSLGRLQLLLVFRESQLEFSWVHRALNNNLLTALLVAGDVMIVESASYLAMAFISFTAKMVTCRLRAVKEEIQSHGPNQNGEFLRDECTKLEKLEGIHRALNDASKYIIFGTMAFSTIVVAFLVFVILMTLKSATQEHHILMLGLCSMMFSLFWRMMVLCNAGESLQQEVKDLRLVIMKTRVQSDFKQVFAQAEELRHLKDLASVLDFELSCCGFLTVNRRVITSIVSAILTYNIVLTQFHDSENMYAANKTVTGKAKP